MKEKMQYLSPLQRCSGGNFFAAKYSVCYAGSRFICFSLAIVTKNNGLMCKTTVFGAFVRCHFELTE